MRYTMSDKDELTMPRDTKQHSQQFKEDAVRYKPSKMVFQDPFLIRMT